MATEFEIKLRAKSVEQLGEILRDAQVVKFAQEKLREIHSARRILIRRTGR